MCVRTQKERKEVSREEGKIRRLAAEFCDFLSRSCFFFFFFGFYRLCTQLCGSRTPDSVFGCWQHVVFCGGFFLGAASSLPFTSEINNNVILDGTALYVVMIVRDA